jgi:cation-transporting ATPase 13A2
LGGDDADGAGTANGAQMLLAADAVMVQGTAVVDESLLTGETMPIQKFAVAPDAMTRDPGASEDKKIFLFAGTQLLHATGGEHLPEGVREGAVAVVSHVGPRSCRGGLLRTLL